MILIGRLEHCEAPVTPHFLKILENLDRLPPSAVVPIPVVALYHGVSEKTVRRTYRLIAVSEGRMGVRRADLDRPPVIRGRGRPRKSQANTETAA
jgi:hypothetical protein